MSKVTIQFADDTTGKNADIEIVPNGHVHKLSVLLESTPLAADGYVTSIQLLANRTGVTAEVKDNNAVVATAVGDGDNFATISRTSINELTVIATKA